MSSFERPLVVSGPSGVGKSTLLKRLLDRQGEKFGFSVSHTTRQPRSGEVNGEHYHFTDPDTFIKLRNDGGFIETAQFASNFYGTSKKAVQDVQDKGRRCILDIEAQGVRQVKQTDLNPVYLFIAPPSIEELKIRLTGRGSDKQDAVAARLRMAIEEIDYATTGAHDFIVKNDDLDRAYEKFETIALGGDIASDSLPEIPKDSDSLLSTSGSACEEQSTPTNSNSISGSTSEERSTSTNSTPPTSASSEESYSKPSSGVLGSDNHRHH